MQKYGDVYSIVQHYSNYNSYNKSLFENYGKRDTIWKSIKQDSDINRYISIVQNMVVDNNVIIKLKNSDDDYYVYMSISNAIIAIEKNIKCASAIGVGTDKFLKLEMSVVDDVLCKAGKVLEKIKEKGSHLPPD